MSHDISSRREKAAVVLGGLLILLSLCGLLWLLRAQLQPRPVPEPPAQTEPDAPTLAGADYYQPESLHVGEALPSYEFSNGAGERVNLLEAYPGERLVLMYWGSWCPYCEEQLRSMEEFREILRLEGNTRLILVNKTDSEREETVEKGERYLSEKGWIDCDRVYDTDLKGYRAYGMKRIPTSIVLDETGIFRAAASCVLDGEGLRELLQQARTGHALAQLSFLNRAMTGGDGGVFTAYRDSSGASPQGHDVLSESMGLLMACAVSLEDRGLFDRCWSYVSEKMERDGLIVWYVDADGNQADSNALLDDLRIAAAVYEANEKWGGYDDALRRLSSALLQKNVYREQLSSFYDFRQRRAGSSIALAYADFSALDALSQLQPEFSPLRETLLETVQGGFIREEFPLYYSAYDYRTQCYRQDSLNTAEALLTVYHLAEIDRVREESLLWLREALRSDTLFARYRVDGTVETGYAYGSTAVYAIAALIGQTAGDAELYRLAREKMERSWIGDRSSAFYGAFSLRVDGGDIQAFDQLMPLTVYCRSQSLRFASPVN